MLLEIKVTESGTILENKFLFVEGDKPLTKEKLERIANIQIEAISRTLHKERMIDSEKMP